MKWNVIWYASEVIYLICCRLQYYKARIESIFSNSSGKKLVTVFYTDYGNRESVSFADIRELPDPTWVSDLALLHVIWDFVVSELWVDCYQVTVKSQLQAAAPHPCIRKLPRKFGSHYMGIILVPIDKPHWYFTDVVRSVTVTSRTVICQTQLF